MKQILAHGDSLTCGTNPASDRHQLEDLWPSGLMVQAALGHESVVAIGPTIMNTLQTIGLL